MPYEFPRHNSLEHFWKFKASHSIPLDFQAHIAHVQLEASDFHYCTPYYTLSGCFTSKQPFPCWNPGCMPVFLSSVSHIWVESWKNCPSMRMTTSTWLQAIIFWEISLLRTSWLWCHSKKYFMPVFLMAKLCQCAYDNKHCPSLSLFEEEGSNGIEGQTKLKKHKL